MPNVFSDATANDYDLLIPTAADWTVSSGGLPNGDNYLTGDAAVTATYNLNGDDFHLGDGTAWTVEYWYYASSTLGGSLVIVGVEATDGSAQYWQAQMATGGGGIPSLSIYTSGGTYATVTYSPSTLSTGAWHHIVFAKPSGTGGIKMYVDGSLFTTGSTASGTAATPTSTSRLYFGAGSLNTGDLRTESRVSKLAIYNSELSGARVSAHYAAMTT